MPCSCGESEAVLSMLQQRVVDMQAKAMAEMHRQQGVEAGMSAMLVKLEQRPRTSGRDRQGQAHRSDARAIRESARTQAFIAKSRVDTAQEFFGMLKALSSAVRDD